MTFGEIIETLPEQEKALMTAKYIHEHSYERIAEDRGITLDEAKQIVFIARKALMDAINEAP